MKNIVSQLDAIKKAIEAESSLRSLASSEFDNGERDGIYKRAHDQAIETVLSAAKALIDQSQATDE